jgi:HEAT repeat protein
MGRKFSGEVPAKKAVISMDLRVLELARRGATVGDNFVMTCGADVRAMEATVGEQNFIAVRPPDVPVLAGDVSRPTPLSTLCGLLGAARIWHAVARCFAAAALALLTALSLAHAQDMTRSHGSFETAVRKLVVELDGCQDLPACLAVLDDFVPSLSPGQASGEGPTIAHSLKRFGEMAKQELLRRAASADPGWPNLAGDILSYWGGWSPSDVPALRAALRLRHGGWIARPLAEIRTPEAIEALVEDLAVVGSANQTGWALARTGHEALPYLLPIFADEQRANDVASVIHQMGKEALVVAPDWVSMVANPDNPKNVRLAALRGLAAMGDGVGQQGKDLGAMLASPDADIRTQTFKTLVAIRDPSVVMTVAENCRPSGKAFYEIPLESRHCLLTVAAFGEHARTAGSPLMEFLASPNGEEVATAATALGYIGHLAAIPHIEQQLRSPDWRVVYAAARSLGWLGAVDSVQTLERVASSHWLPEVRDQALMAVDALKGGEQRLARPPSFKEPNGALPLFSIGRSTLRSQPMCSSRRWEWNGIRFSRPTSSTRVLGLALGPGALVGSNRGEWGGDLTWKPVNGQVQLLHKHNVVAIQPADGGAIVLFGLDHMGLVDGYAVRVSRRGDDDWSLSEVARLPSTADALATIEPNLFAAWSESRVVVFSDQEIVGLAKCVAN